LCYSSVIRRGGHTLVTVCQRWHNQVWGTYSRDLLWAASPFSDGAPAWGQGGSAPVRYPGLLLSPSALVGFDGTRHTAGGGSCLARCRPEGRATIFDLWAARTRLLLRHDLAAKFISSTYIIPQNRPIGSVDRPVFCLYVRPGPELYNCTGCTSWRAVTVTRLSMVLYSVYRKTGQKDTGGLDRYWGLGNGPASEERSSRRQSLSMREVAVRPAPWTPRFGPN
jgi:hypothetical protein